MRSNPHEQGDDWLMSPDEYYVWLQGVENMSDMVNVRKKCIQCKRDIILVVKEQDWNEYTSNGDRKIQQIFPYLTADQREILISGFCGWCFDLICAEEETLNM